MNLQKTQFVPWVSQSFLNMEIQYFLSSMLLETLDFTKQAHVPLKWEGIPVKQFQDFHRKFIYSSISWIFLASSYLHGEQSTYINNEAPFSSDVSQDILNLD